MPVIYHFLLGTFRPCEWNKRPYRETPLGVGMNSSNATTLFLTTLYRRLVVLFYWKKVCKKERTSNAPFRP